MTAKTILSSASPAPAKRREPQASHEDHPDFVYVSFPFSPINFRMAKLQLK